MDLGLKGVPAAVAASSKGLGFAVASALAEEGAKVAICSRDPEAIKRAAGRIPGGAIPITADVSTEEGARGFVEQAADALGGLQILVTNAGGPPPGTASTFDDDRWLDAIHLNFLSAVRMVRAALPHLRAREWGRILAITSTTVKQPIETLALSNAARAATNAFMKSLADEIGPEAITVNCIMPGQIATERLASLAGAPPGAKADDPAFSSMAERIPLKRVGEPQEFASVAAFLCSARASFVNGVALQVDGGLVRSAL